MQQNYEMIYYNCIPNITDSGFFSLSENANVKKVLWMQAHHENLIISHNTVAAVISILNSIDSLKTEKKLFCAKSAHLTDNNQRSCWKLAVIYSLHLPYLLKKQRLKNDKTNLVFPRCRSVPLLLNNIKSL